jgi:hypothetical protein
VGEVKPIKLWFHLKAVMRVKSDDIVVMFALFAAKWQNKRLGKFEIHLFNINMARGW